MVVLNIKPGFRFIVILFFLPWQYFYTLDLTMTPVSKKFRDLGYYDLSIDMTTKNVDGVRDKVSSSMYGMGLGFLFSPIVVEF